MANTDQYTGLENGTIDAGALTFNAIADEAIEIFSPVILVAAGTGERLPRVEPNASQGVAAVGVVVNGDNDGTVSGSDQESASAAGQAVSVCYSGRCKVRVLASTVNIAVGDKLTIAGTDERAEKAVTGDEIFGVALQASTADGDYIACLVNPQGVV